MRFLSLDVSTNTGWAIFDDAKLTHFGVFTCKVPGYKAAIKSYKDFPETYPYNFMDTADEIAKKCKEIADEFQPDNIVIEHTEGSKQRISQRLLEWTHYTIYQILRNDLIPSYYLLVADWRTQVKCYLKYWPEHSKWNKEVAKAKKITPPRKRPRINGNVVSRIDLKKLSILIANEHFDIQTKNDNIADAINLGRAAWELNIFR